MVNGCDLSASNSLVAVLDPYDDHLSREEVEHLSLSRLVQQVEFPVGWNSQSSQIKRAHRLNRLHLIDLASRIDFVVDPANVSVLLLELLINVLSESAELLSALWVGA